MKSIVIFSALLALAVAAPFEEAHVSIVQDSNGNYKLVYHSNSISRNEQRTQDGKVVGDYTFVDDHGHHHLIRYLAAEDHGFTADGADIPVSVPEPIEVIQSRSEHLAVLQRERASNPLGSSEERPVSLHEVLSKLTVPQIASLPVEAVPFEDHEVSHAKAEHLRAYAEALARLAEEYKRTGSF